MSNYLSRAEIDKISEGLLEMYDKQRKKKTTSYVDIEHFITDFLKLKIQYAAFAEEDMGRIGFLSDGETPLMIYQNGQAIPYIFPKDTIVLDEFLRSEKEIGRRRFTMSHEAAHSIFQRMNCKQHTSRFHTEYDNERAYSIEELKQIFAASEWQSDAMGASLLMPKYLIEKNAKKVGVKIPIKVYGDTVFSPEDKMLILQVAKIMKVSYTALVIRMKDLDMLEYHEMYEFIEKELQLGGVD